VDIAWLNRNTEDHIGGTHEWIQHGWTELQKIMLEGHMSGYSMAKQKYRRSYWRDTWVDTAWLNRITEYHVRGTHDWIEHG